MPCNDKITCYYVLFRVISCRFKLVVILLEVILFFLCRLACWLDAWCSPWLGSVDHDLWLAISLVNRWAHRCIHIPWDILLRDHNGRRCRGYRLLGYRRRFTCDIFWRKLSCVCIWCSFWGAAHGSGRLRIRIVTLTLPCSCRIVCIICCLVQLDDSICLLRLWCPSKHFHVHLLTARRLLMSSTPGCHMRVLFTHWFRARLLLHIIHLQLTCLLPSCLWSWLCPSYFWALCLVQRFDYFLTGSWITRGHQGRHTVFQILFFNFQSNAIFFKVSCLLMRILRWRQIFYLLSRVGILASSSFFNIGSAVNCRIIDWIFPSYVRKRSI